MKIGILTAFQGSDTAYSLVNVVAVQLRMLLDAGYRPVLLVGLNFAGPGIWDDPRVTVRKITPQTLPTALNDVDVVLCHDIVFLTQHSAYGEVVRQLASERPRLAWLHWQHSRGDPQVEPCANSWYCYPNAGDLNHVAWLNQAPIERIRYIPHPLDLAYLGWPDLAIKIADDYHLPDRDIVGILPTRLDRQKQVDKALRLFAGLQRAGKSVCLLVADALATGEHFMEYKRDLLDLAQELGVSAQEFAFLGEQYQECHTGTPRATVKALLEMSNLFVQPSNAETSSLVVLEAALAGNLCIINEDFPPIHDLYRDALRLPFGSVLHGTDYWRHEEQPDGEILNIPDDQQFWDDQARLTVLPALDQHTSIKVKRQQLRERWPARVMLEYLEPLILEAYHAQRGTIEVSSTGDKETTAIVTTLDNLPLLRRQIPILLEECERVIVVNNGSIDGTREWLDHNQWANVTVIHKENNGAGPGRNAGLALWDARPTPYTLMVDGGILPLPGGVREMKRYLIEHPGVDVISPEVASGEHSCFTDNEAHSSTEMQPIDEDMTFPQCTLSGTAYALARASAWRVRFCEEGPFGRAGWGCDDNEMQYRWNAAGVVHHDFKRESRNRIYRRGSGSFQRLYRETGIWPNQYGSVYEQRNVKMFQDWRQYYDPVWGTLTVDVSFMLDGLQYPDLALTVKRLHDENIELPHEIIVVGNHRSPDVNLWLELFALRWHTGDTTISPRDGKPIKRSERNEAIWSGDVLIDRSPRGKSIEWIKAHA